MRAWSHIQPSVATCSLHSLPNQVRLIIFPWCILSLIQEIPPPPGISMEEANELQENIERLEGELVELRAELAAKEDTNNQLSKKGGRDWGRERGWRGELIVAILYITTWTVLFSGPEVYKGRLKSKGVQVFNFKLPSLTPPLPLEFYNFLCLRPNQVPWGYSLRVSVSIWRDTLHVTIILYQEYTKITTALWKVLVRQKLMSFTCSKCFELQSSYKYWNQLIK